jgi:hypothetical protein
MKIIEGDKLRGKVMIKWEYCIVDISPQGEAKVVYLKPVGQKHRAERIEEIYQVLAQLGLEGWELVSHTQTISEYFTLKRPLIDTEEI